MKATWLLALVLAGGSAHAGSVEDDLRVVKKAVSVKSAPAQAVESQEQEKDAPRVRARKGKEPQWLRVRVVEKAGKKVSVNLPLALVRAIGDDMPIGPHCRREGKCATLTIGDVLRALDSGQDLVQVEDEDAQVRVWVE
jgi:hypothetical protein